MCVFHFNLLSTVTPSNLKTETRWMWWLLLTIDVFHCHLKTFLFSKSFLHRHLSFLSGWSLRIWPLGVRQSLAAVVLVSTTDYVSPTGFWVHYNIFVLTYLLTCVAQRYIICHNTLLSNVDTVVIKFHYHHYVGYLLKRVKKYYTWAESSSWTEYSQ